MILPEEEPSEVVEEPQAAAEKVSAKTPVATARRRKAVRLIFMTIIISNGLSLVNLCPQCGHGREWPGRGAVAWAGCGLGGALRRGRLEREREAARSARPARAKTQPATHRRKLTGPGASGVVGNKQKPLN